MKKIFTIALSVFALYANAQTTPAWSSVSSNFPNAGTYPLALDAKGNVAWGFGADGTPAQADYKVYTRTSDAGASWTGGTMNGLPANVSISDIAAGDGSTAWVAAYPTSGNGGVWVTTDGGANWTKQATATYSNAASFPNIVYFWDLNTGITMGDPISGGRLETYRTTNGGVTWTSITGAPAIGGEYGYVHNKSVAGDVIWAGSNLGRIFRSNDKGATWLPTVSSPLSDFGGAGESGEIALKDANTAWVASSTGLVYKTTNAGTSFETVDLVTGTFYASSFAYVPGTDQTLLSGGASTANGRGSSISFDGGANWTEITNNSVDVGITEITAVSPNLIYGGSFSDAGTGMNRLTALLATSEAGAVKGISIAPNPTYGDLNISTVLNVKSVEILDMNGRLIKTFGADSKKLDLSSLKVGVYAVKVNTADGKSQITKFIKK